MVLSISFTQALRQEVAYASYLNIQTVILPPPRNRSHVPSYARVVNSCLKNTAFLNFSIRLPIYNPSALRSPSSAPSSPLWLTEPPESSPVLFPGNTPQSLSTAPQGELNATWEMWDLIRSICDYDTRLTLSKWFTRMIMTHVLSYQLWT